MIYQENLGDKQSLVSTIFIIYIFLGIIKKMKWVALSSKYERVWRSRFLGYRGCFSHTKTKAVKLYLIRGASKLSLSDWRA